MMLLSSISSHSFAQASHDPAKLFETQHNPYRRSFYFDLGKKERMQVELYDLADLVYLQHIDSIVDMFVTSLERVKDSVPDPVYSRLIEYTINGPNMKTLSMSKHGNGKTGFVFTVDEVSLLKVEQDTIVIVGTIPGQYTRSLLQRSLRHYRISFFLNDLDRLALIRGHLDKKLQTLYTSVNKGWELKPDGAMHLKNSPDISATARRGYVMGGDIVTVRPSIDIQNYKSWFVPSVTGGISIATNKNLVHREYYLGTEAHFVFGKTDSGQTKAFRNMFLVISYGQSNIDPYTKKSAVLYPFISLGYLVKRKGEYYDRHSFKLALGQFNLFANYTKIEPVVYFHDFFKGLAPSLRITQHF